MYSADKALQSPFHFKDFFKNEGEGEPLIEYLQSLIVLNIYMRMYNFLV